MYGNQQTPRSDLDAYVTRLGQMTEPTMMFTLTADGEVVPHFSVGPAVIKVLLVDEATLRNQVDMIASEIMHWGRVTARQQRCVVVRERQLRTWKAQQELAFRKATEAGKGWGQGGKVSEAQVEAHYRTAAEYGVLQQGIEQAKEAAMVADVVYSAFRSKLQVLRADVVRAPDGSLQRLSP